MIPTGRDAFRFAESHALVGKHDEARVGLGEIERAVREHVAAMVGAQPVPGHPSAQTVDLLASLRVSVLLQGVLACVYSALEIAAGAASFVTGRVGGKQGATPSSFNKLKTRLREGAFPELAAAIGDLGWHDRFHAFRTEWTHFSSVFIAGTNDASVRFCGGAFRRESDKKVVEDRFAITLEEVRALVCAAFESLDRLASWMIPIALRVYDLEHRVLVPEHDEKGWPRQRPDFTFVVREITVRELFTEMGFGPLLPMGPTGPTAQRSPEAAP